MGRLLDAVASVDPTRGVCKLPQPFRAIDKLLSGIVDDADDLVKGVGDDAFDGVGDDPYPVKALLRVAEHARATARDGGELRSLFYQGLADHVAAERMLAEACRV